MSEHKIVDKDPTGEGNVYLCNEIPAGFPVIFVRLSVANALGKGVQIGHEILYSSKTGACVIGPRNNEHANSQFSLEISKRRLKQSFNGELTGTARDRDTCSVIKMTTIDKRIGEIAETLRSLLKKVE